MYPTTFTELTGLLGILVPVVIATFAGLRSTHTKALENNLVQWRRLNELAATLNNHDEKIGLWSQLAAAHELGEAPAAQRAAARSVLAAARLAYISNPVLTEALVQAQQRASRGWWRL
ncbi:hypothetical protein [Sphingomonas sp. 8AM]|uniref:hypothetical protein n=1 Tax=Sphingomonas sp. 8AM TaxID=2653170 RepID=UPI0012F0F809|nr:hypothetical protein [Sphingomonas sp. 8AM]VXD02849.1 hypothetical protein SPHINGO8AM_80270 [Sphingomonas sp. 8AM]